MLAPLKKSYDKPRQHIKKLRYHFADKGMYGQSYVFFPVVMYGCESWTTKLDHEVLMLLNCVLKTLESPLETARKSILKELNPEYSLEGLMQKAEAPILCLTDAKSQLIRRP